MTKCDGRKICKNKMKKNNMFFDNLFQKTWNARRNSQLMKKLNYGWEISDLQTTS